MVHPMLAVPEVAPRRQKCNVKTYHTYRESLTVSPVVSISSKYLCNRVQTGSVNGSLLVTLASSPDHRLSFSSPEKTFCIFANSASRKMLIFLSAAKSSRCACSLCRPQGARVAFVGFSVHEKRFQDWGQLGSRHVGEVDFQKASA